MDITPLSGRRFGLTADTHDVLVDWPKVLDALKTAWGEVDGVLHCGDLSSTVALERLAEVGPVFATRSQDDPPAAAPILCDGPRVLTADGVRIGLTFALPETAKTAAGAAQLFGGPVAACVFGGTHEASIDEADGVLFVNPGSPSLAKTRTAAVLTIEGGNATAEILPIG
jgi:hypothetical protein